MGALDRMSGTGGALGEMKTKKEKETNNIGGKGEKKRGGKQKSNLLLQSKQVHFVMYNQS